MRYLLIASRGSSSNAARYAQYLLGRASRVPVAFATPSLYTLYEQPPRLDGALVIGISQSGESPDVRAVIDEARRQGRPTLAITNSPDSPIGAPPRPCSRSRRARSLPSPRRRRTSTRSVRSRSSSPGRRATRRRCASSSGCRCGSPIRSRCPSRTPPGLDELAGIHGGTVVARGINYGTAFEIALKIRELSGLLFEAYSAADLMHGPVAAVGAGWPVIAVAPSGPALASMETAIAGLAERGARLITIADRARRARPRSRSFPARRGRSPSG